MDVMIGGGEGLVGGPRSYIYIYAEYATLEGELEGAVDGTAEAAPYGMLEGEVDGVLEADPDGRS